MIKTYSRNDLQNDVSAAVRATASGPVIITENGTSAYVLMSMDAYRDLVEPTAKAEQAEAARSLLDALKMPGTETVDPDFEFPEMKGDWGLAGSRP
ncbi:type II toxin-antitoxin system Phd/YefM family antitoxin [Rhizobium sp. YIM 134829]|uniref:type II toxin-antitoxin system Phd/YefM family antitoxin n=1 Tax=Rhizobium sp. YIM 134829 TaxID=3390453 RepID=UPI00397B04E7